VSVSAPDLEAVNLASRSATCAARIATLSVEGATTSETVFLNNTRLSRPLAPLGNQVLVKLRRGEEKTGGGLFVPSAEAEKPKEGTVVAVGPGTFDEESGKITPCMVAPGDLVLLSDFTGDNVDYNGQKHIFVDGDSILGVFANNEVTVSGFTPLGDRVMVAMAQKATETTTGIALALDEEDSADSMGEAVAVGAGRYYNGSEIKPVDVSVGDTVLYRERSGSEANIDGQRFVIVEERNLLAKW
jgi:chaperonin GroES